MGNKKGWLRARERHQILIAEIKRIAGGSLIAALIVGPLIYFSVVAMPLELREEQKAMREATPDVDIAAETEVRTSVTPLPLPTVDTKTAKIIAKSKVKDLKLTPDEEKFDAAIAEPIETISGDLTEEKELKFESFFGEQDAKMKEIAFTDPAEPERQPLENRMLVIEDVIVDEGPAKVETESDAAKVAKKALQQYLRSELKLTDFRIFDDTATLDKNKKPYQFVLNDIKHNNGKWYVTFSEYSNALPVFDGNVKFIFTESKKLLVISDNIKRDLPDETEFKIGRAVVEQNVKQVFEWDNSIDKIEFIDKGYFKGAPAYRAQTNAHNPAGDWEIFVEGVEGNVESMAADVRLQDEPATPEPSIEPEVITEPEPAIIIDYSSTPEPTTLEPATSEPEIQILDVIFSQILGKIYPQTPSDEPVIEPLAHSYAYINDAPYVTDSEGYFENQDMLWYTTFLDGPYVTVTDDDATSNIEIENQTPQLPFTWDENSASLAAINAFYHTNKIHDYFANNLGYEIGKNIPLTVNSRLVDAYIDGCGAWFNNSEKTIEMGRGGSPSCPAELNYALGSDFVYHEYAHFMVEDVTHLPYILGSETAAMSEGLSDYFAATINNDPMWGEVIAPSRKRNLVNTLNYQTDMIGQSHHDGMILSGALWDLRTAIGAEATDKLVFNALFQDRYHFETLMYAMIIEDDDNGDFSDGTPHLAEIITAFDKHGIGPGIANFNGLPLTPEAWAELLGEEVPEGEEEPLLEAHSGNCVTGGVSPNTYLSVPTSPGGTCSVTSSETYDYLYVYTGGTLVIGNYNSSNTTLTINSDASVQGGEVQIGYNNTATTVAARLAVSGNLSISTNTTEGFVFTRGGGASANNDLTVGGTLNVGTNTGNSGRLNLVDNVTTNTAGTTYVYGDLTVYNGAKLDTGGYTYVHGSTNANLVVNSGGTYETNYLNMGESDASPNGGTISNSGTLTVVYSLYMYDYADLTNSNSMSIARYFSIEDNATVTNSGTLSQTGSAYYARMYDDCTFTNTGTVNIAGYFLMDQVSTTLQADQPILNNNGGDFNVTITTGAVGSTGIIMYDYSLINNATAGAAAELDVENDIDLRNSAKIVNGASGTTTYGQIWIRDDLLMSNNTQLINYYLVYVGAAESDGSTTTNTYIQGAALIHNADSSSWFDNDNSGASTYGLLTILDTAEFRNDGIAYFRRMALGNQGSNIQGGTFNNRSGGDLYVYETSLSYYAVDVWKGTLNNQSGSDTFSIDGVAKIWGDSSTNGQIIHADNAGYIAKVEMYDYSLLDVNASTLYIDGNGTTANANLTLTNDNTLVDIDGALNVYNTLSANNNSQIDINGTFTVGSTATLNDSSVINSNSGTTNFNGGVLMYNYAYITNLASTTINMGNGSNEGLSMEDYSEVNNSGTINVYDDLVMSGETSCNAVYTNNSGAQTNVTGTTTNSLVMRFASSITNSGTGVFDVDYAAASTTDGFVQIYETSTLTNTGTFKASRVFLGNVTLATAGGTITNGSGGTFQVSSNSSALDIYRATFNNNSGSVTAEMVNDGLVSISGDSSASDYGSFLNYTTAEGKFSIDVYGRLYVYNGATYTASTGELLGNTSSQNGLIQVNSGGTLAATTLNIGTASYSAGTLLNYGTTSGTDLYVYEDTANADTDYEITNYASNGFINYTNIYIGSATRSGGEIYNTAGDGTAYGTDGANEGIRGITTIYSGGNIYNGNTRPGTGTNYPNAEYNHETTPTSGIGIEAGGRVDNYGYVGGTNVSTSLTTGAPKIFNNKNTGKVRSSMILFGNSGLFYNGQDSSTSGADVNTGTGTGILIVGTGEYNNYGSTTTAGLTIGSVTYNGGTLNLEDGGTGKGTFAVTGTGTSAANVTYGGTINVKTGHDSFTVIGRTNVSSAVASASTINSSAITTFGELYIGEYGIVNVNNSTLSTTTANGNTGNLNISGTTSGNGGKLIVANTTDDAKMQAAGTTTINNYGTLENNAYISLTSTGFSSGGLATVASGGKIISDDTSNFGFPQGITSAGTVEIDDNLSAGNNSSSGYAIQVTGGTFTTGLATNTGYTGTVLSQSVGDVMISGGTFTTYNTSKFDDVTVTGATTVANFENSTSPVTCKTDIHGYFDILAGATAEINCSNTDDAVYVHSGSPGGNTQVEGTLIVNTNIETETMVIGGSTTGTITHDVVNCYGLSQAQCPSGWFPSPNTVNVINVLETLTINSNGSINVSEKSYKRASYYDPGNGRGGSYGGVGQHVTSVATNAYGNMVSWLANFGSMGYSSYSLTQNFGAGSITFNIGGAAGGIVNLTVGEDTDAVPDGILDTGTITFNTGFILANGQNAYDGAGSGGSININTHTITGTAGIMANGGNATGGGPSAPDDHTAGAGGRIYIQYYDKSGLAGTVSARGGYNDETTVAHSGTGTIFYKWTDKWQNQNDGTLVIDGMTGTDTIDVDLDNSTAPTDVDDATEPTENISIESVQADRYAAFYVKHAGSTVAAQQCIEANGGVVHVSGVNITYNRDHGGTGITDCIETPDPPATLYINNSGTGAQSGQAGDKTVVPPPSVVDLTPAVSGIHKDAALDRTGTTESPDHDVYKYQLIIGSSVNNVWNDTAITGCNIDSTRFPSNLDYTHNARTGDIIVPPACAANLAGNNTYYWKIRFMEDLNDDYNDDSDPATEGKFWGLWSATNHFDIEEGAIIELDSCGFGGNYFNLGPYSTEAGDNFFKDACYFLTDATVTTYIKANINGNLASLNGTVWNMANLDTDPLTGLDGENNQLPAKKVNEAGFYLSSVNATEFTIGQPYAGIYYDTHYTKLPSSATTILTSTGGYSDETFYVWIGAFIHGLINADDPTTESPTNYCSATQTTAPCISDHDTSYSSTFTITASTSP